MKHGRHVTIKRRRQLATASSKEELAAWSARYEEPFHLSQLHDDVVEDRQAHGTLAQLACEMRMHSAWKANFDALQFANTKLDSDVLSNMGSHLSYLQQYKALPEATHDRISECFICPKKKAMELSAEMAAEQLLAEEAADQAQAEAKKAKKQRQKAKKQQAQTVLHAQQSRQTEQFCIHGRQESQPAQQEEHQSQCAQQEEPQTQRAQQEEPQAQHAQHEEQQAQHAQQEKQQAQHAQQEEQQAQHEDLQAQHAQKEEQQAQHAQHEELTVRQEAKQAQHAQRRAQQTEHEQDPFAAQDAGQPLVKKQTLPSQHAQQALHSQQAAQSEQPLSKQHTQQQQLGQGCQRSLASSEEQLSVGTESRPHCLKHNSHHQHKQLASGVLPVMLKSKLVSQTDAAAQPPLDQNSQLAGTGRHTAAQSMDDKALFNLCCCPLTKAAMHDPVIAADGHTYERHAMEQWLRQHATSPLTGAQLSHLRLVPNIIVRSIVRTQQQG